MNKYQLTKEVIELKDETIKIRRDIHKNPELGFQEFKTSELIYNTLKELGYEVSIVAKTGVVGLIRGHDQTKTLAVRADIDCLPLQELNQVDYISQNEGKMHACGHDGHTAIALATAKLIKSRQSELKGNVKFIFQPAEESPGGAEPMIKEGVLENPKVDAIIGLHLWNNIPLGTLGIKSGILMASADEFIINIKGKGGHGALPHQTVDSIVVMAHIITALQTIVSRNVNPLEPAVVTVGKVESGSNFNIIAESAKMIGTVRTFDNDLRDQIEKKIEQITKNITQAFGADYSYQYIKFYPPTINDVYMASLIKEAALDVVSNDMILENEITMGAEDMSYFLQKVPGCYFFVGSANKEKGLDKPHHNPYFDFDEEALSIGTQVMTNAIFKYFER
ncbi:MAG: amidohydrolase [Candidatus Sericytochromatia bacterium]|nr:amidohydrolase [Candidatus Sericytochromatia bacterium]